VAASPQTKPVNLGCESAENWQLSSTSTIAIVIITQPYSFYRPTKGGRLSRPRHCSKGGQTVIKTVYRSSCRDKHNCQWRDSNLDPLTPQSDALTTRLLRPAKVPLPWGSEPHLTHGFLGPTTPHPKRHLNRFSRFCTAHQYGQRTQKDHDTPSVAIGRICSMHVLWPNR